MNTFVTLGINDDLLKGIAAIGFEQPTPIQEEVIPLILDQQADMICLAQTGTGKTAAFGLPLIQLTEEATRQTQALVLCPTRELCVQVSRDLTAFARYVKGLNIAAIYGGASMEQQIRMLRRGTQIIVATPGRLNDLINRGQVDISQVRYAIFDEADEMLNMGFQEELNAILAQTPAEKNTLLFSATMSREIKNIAGKYMSEPMEVTIGKLNAGAEHVEHEYYLVQARNRYPALKRIVDNAPGNYSIIFCRTRQETQEVADKLSQDGYNAEALHGDLSQAQRDQVMQKFRRKSLQILVATDVAARGLDVNDLSHVINYNLPDDIANYTHRSGRTGRAGRKGTSVAIIQAREQFRIRQIEKKIKKKFSRKQIPSGLDICKKQLFNLAESLTTTEVDCEQVDQLYPEIAAMLAEVSREELIKKLLSREFKQFFNYYRNAPDLNIKEGELKRASHQERSGKNEQRFAGGKHQFTRFHLNVGRKDGLLPQGLIGTINGAPGGGRIKVGKIDIMQTSAFLEADSRYIPQIMNAFRHTTINGKTVSITIARGKPPIRHPKQGELRRSKRRKFKHA
ncbi:DEAD/DEAH box helicase [Desulfogranum mediterraneum]|uniref:DEAD/DEAH box helicase n=1 Tax=Desulfogranum mediterraneum TaxID=160661 RepID=UPI000408F51C|nr:DEAD/DEAH box helicase [Desulfogranum mediterraneum]